MLFRSLLLPEADLLDNLLARLMEKSGIKELVHDGVLVGGRGGVSGCESCNVGRDEKGRMEGEVLVGR